MLTSSLSMYLYHFTLQSYEACHLEAICGISEDQPAMLIVYQESTLTERVIIRKIPFTCVKNVGQVKDRPRMIIAIELQKDQFLFYAESAVATPSSDRTEKVKKATPGRKVISGVCNVRGA